MNETKETFEELFKKVDEFEKTVTGLLDNIRKFKAKLLDNKTTYGPDPSKWPANK